MPLSLSTQDIFTSQLIDQKMIESESPIQLGSSHSDQISHQDIIERTTPPKSREGNIESSFEKNYPKNIFIPVIEYLAQLGLKKEYQACVGTREKFQGKNVVSLGLIHLLISQNWFCKSVDRNILLANLSNKIMMNSKIKKKLFHLKVAKSIFSLPPMECKEFKKKVSKQANLIASEQIGPSDQLFEAPNSIIYLLRLFLKTLLLHTNLKHNDRISNISHKQTNEFSDGQQGYANGSKEQYKFLVKEIAGIFNRRNLNAFDLVDTYQQIRGIIEWRDTQLKNKFQFGQGVPNWGLFISCVVDKCFHHKKLDMRITNSAINEWVNQFRNKSTSVVSMTKLQDKWYGARIFEPIVIYPPQL